MQNPARGDCHTKRPLTLAGIVAMLVSLLTPVATQAATITIDFNSFAAGYQLASGAIVEDGVTMQYIGFGDSPFIAFYAAGGGNDGNGLFDSNTGNASGAEAIFSMGGQMFNLVSYDLIREGASGSFRIDVAGVSYTGLASNSVTTVTRNLMGITSFNVNSVSLGGNYGIDNIVIETIPEPATLSLVALGGAAAALRRRRRRKG